MPTPLEALLVELAAAADALAAGDAVTAASAIERAVSTCAGAAPGLTLSPEELRQGTELHQRCEALAASLHDLLSKEVSQSGASTKARGAYRKTASGG